MPAPETLDSIASELRAMSPRSRRQVLARLTPAERERVERHLNEAPAASPTVDVSSPDPLSPWLDQAITAARSGMSSVIAPRTRTALVDIADAMQQSRVALREPEPRKEPGRSLVEAFGGMLPTRRAR